MELFLGFVKPVDHEQVYFIVLVYIIFPFFGLLQNAVFSFLTVLIGKEKTVGNA